MTRSPTSVHGSPPARAGNTAVTSRLVPRPPVHPCAGREHHDPDGIACHLTGSPLRGQGTPWGQSAAGGVGRFTPARAGNTQEKPNDRTTTTVHPCAGREHQPVTALFTPANGSPLRGQGTRAGGPELGRRGRFTPARAGNTRPRGYSAVHDTVHPCAGREHMTVSASV